MPDDPSSVWRDPVIEVYKRDVDRTLLRENLKLTPGQRLDALQKLVEFTEELRRAMKKAEGGTMTDFAGLIRVLHDSKVDFILIGGLAAAAHGAIRATKDVDVVYARTQDNIARLASALTPLDAYLRGAPPGLPFRWDAETIAHGLNFTLTTSLGDIDLLGEVAGGGGYQELLPHSIAVEAFGVPCLCLDLDMLIHVKRAAGRPKDFEAIAELEALVEERDRQRSGNGL